MRLSILTLLATVTSVFAVPAAVPVSPLYFSTPSLSPHSLTVQHPHANQPNLQLNPISAKRSPGLAALDPRQNYCFGFGNICFTQQDCKDVGCAGCIDAPEVDPNHMICY
jgi:hypothetical protein